MSRQTIGQNPLDALLNRAEENETKAETKTRKPTAKPEAVVSPSRSKEETLEKQRLTVQISADIIERAKNTVYWTRGMTLAQLTEEGLDKVISSLEKSSVIYDDKTGKPLKDKGLPFPKRQEELKSGRPVK